MQFQRLQVRKFIIVPAMSSAATAARMHRQTTGRRHRTLHPKSGSRTAYLSYGGSLAEANRFVESLAQ